MKRIILFMFFLLTLSGCSGNVNAPDMVTSLWDGVLRNESGSSILEEGSKVPVSVQDQTTDIIDVYMMRMLNNVTIAVNTSIGDRNVTLEAGHGFSVNDWVCFQEDNRLYQAQAIAVNGDIITFDTPLDYAFTSNAFGCRSNINMNVDGSVTPIIFRIKPRSEHFNLSWDVTRVICHITDNNDMDDSLFGSRTSLTNGFLLRKKDGDYKNLFNVKTNGQFAEIAYDVAYDSRAPAGQYGFRVRKTWAGQDKSGVVIRLEPRKDDELQALVQDDLTTQNRFICRIIGHLTNELSI